MPKIRLRRGTESDLPTLSAGEPGFTTDTKKLFIGSSSGNVELAKKTDVDANIQALRSDVDAKNSARITEISTLRNDVTAKVDEGNNTIQQLDSRVSNIVASAGNSNTEIVDARGTFPVLRDRLNGFSAELAQNAKKNSNVISIENYEHLIPNKNASQDEWDWTDALRQAIADIPISGGIVNLLSKKINVKNISVSKDNITFLGNEAEIIFNSLSTGNMFDISGKKNITFDGLILNGNTPVVYTIASVQGNRTGISITTSSNNIKIKDCVIKDFNSKGLYVAETGYNPVHTYGVDISRTTFDGNYTGIHFDERAEYCRLNMVSAVRSRIGFYNKCANTHASLCFFNDNVDGTHLILASTNDSHAGFSQCTWNHNSNHAIYGDGVSIGYTFSGCHIHANAYLHLKNCKGMTFVNCQIRQITIRLEGGGYNLFESCLFLQGGTTIAHAYNGVKDKTVFRNNKYQDGTSDSAIDTPNTIILSRGLVETVMSGVHTADFNNFIVSTSYGSSDTSLYDATNKQFVVPERAIYDVYVKLVLTNNNAANATVKINVQADGITSIAQTSVNLLPNQTGYVVLLQGTRLLGALSKIKVVLAGTNVTLVNNQSETEIQILQVA